MTLHELRPRHIVALIMNIAIIVLVFMAWLGMFFRGGGSLLSTSGIRSLVYFTVLSNLLEAVASIFMAVQLVLVLCERRGKVRHGVFLLKYIAVVAVFITFFVVVAFLGPLYGFRYMYNGANFWLHLVVPLLALIEFIFVDRFDSLRFSETFLAMLSVGVYGTVYMLNLLINGVGEWPDTNDIYGFVNWGFPIGIGIFATLILISWGAGCLLRLCNRKKSYISGENY